MKLFEVAGKQPGHWTYHEDSDGVRHWEPIFSGKSTDPQLFPFTPSGTGGSEAGMAGTIAAFNLKQKGMTYEKLKKLGLHGEFKGLLDALKKRGDGSNIIDEPVFNKLMDQCASLVIGKGNLRRIISNGNQWNRMIMVTPESSSKVAEAFATTIQHAIHLPDKQVFHGHFSKREVDDFYMHVDSNPNLNEPARIAILKRLNRLPTGQKMQAKTLKQGDREDARKAGSHLMHVSKDIEVTHETHQSPVLVVVDDNVQTGTTFKTIGELFKQHTGITPRKVISVSMFRL